MELDKGLIYKVRQEEWMAEPYAEHHSTYPREADGANLHNMIFRDRTGSLEMGLFMDEDIIKLSRRESV